MSFRHNLLRAGLLLMALLSLSLGEAKAASDRGRILVLRSNDALPSEEMLTGFQAYLAEQGIEVDLDVHSLEKGGDLGDVASDGKVLAIM